MQIKAKSYLNVAYIQWRIYYFYHGSNPGISKARERDMWYWLFVAAMQGEI